MCIRFLARVYGLLLIEAINQFCGAGGNVLEGVDIIYLKTIRIVLALFIRSKVQERKTLQ